MNRPVLVLACILLPTVVIAEEPVTIPLHFERKLAHEGHGFVPLFEYGRDAAVFCEGERFEITPPPLQEDTRVGYGFIYFDGRPQARLDRRILFLVERFDDAEPRFHVDGNGNLDLTDDAQAVRREDDATAFLMTLRAAGDADRTFTVRLEFFRNHANIKKSPALLTQFGSMLAGFVKRMGGKALAPQHWFADQRLNIRSASVRVGERAFQIGVFDENCNGSYADRGSDMVLVGEFDGTYLSSKKSDGATTLEPATLIQAADQTFEVIEVHPGGEFIRIQASDKPYTRLRNGSTLPEQELTLLDGRKVPLASFIQPDRFLLLDFWGHWCLPCIQAFPALEAIASEWQGDLTILGLHTGDHDEARKVIEQKGSAWAQAEAPPALMEALLVDGQPYYVLVDGDGRIRKLGTSLTEVAQIVRADRAKEE